MPYTTPHRLTRNGEQIYDFMVDYDLSLDDNKVAICDLGLEKILAKLRTLTPNDEEEIHFLAAHFKQLLSQLRLVQNRYILGMVDGADEALSNMYQTERQFQGKLRDALP